MKINPQVYENVISLYRDKMSATAISKRIGVSTSSVIRYLHKSGIQVTKNYTKYSANHSYFEKIDSEDKAYFLGFIAADGFVQKNSIGIEINSQDKKIIEAFLDKTESNNPIYERVRTHKSGKKSKMASICITSKEMVSCLARLGIKQRKTFNLDWKKTTKNIPKHLLRHFVRGFFDGDGWFVQKRFAYGFVGASENFMNGLANYLESMKCLSNRYRRAGERAFQIAVNGRLLFLNFHKLIYENSSIFLERKKNMAKSINYSETKGRKTGPKSLCV